MSSQDRHDMSSLQIARLDSDVEIFRETVKAARILTGKADGPMSTGHYRNELLTNLQVIAERLQDSTPRHPVLLPFVEPLSKLAAEQFANPDIVAQCICDLHVPETVQEKGAKAEALINPFANFKGPN